MRISDGSSDVCSSDLVQRKRLPDVADDALDGLGHAFGGGVDDEVWGDRRLVGGGDAGELGDLAGAGALVEALGVAPLAGRHVGLDVEIGRASCSERVWQYV